MFKHYFEFYLLQHSTIFYKLTKNQLRMKKALLFSLFTLLSLAAFAQCGGTAHGASSPSDNTVYIYTKPKAEVKLKYLVFPNPTMDAFKLDEESIEKGTASKINVYNAMGQLQRSFTVEKETRYNVSDLKDGLYFVQILDAKGKMIVTQKLSKTTGVTRF